MKRVNLLGVNGEIAMRFDSVVEAANYLGIQPTTVIYRIRKKNLVDGFVLCYENLTIEKAEINDRLRRQRKAKFGKTHEDKCCRVKYSYIFNKVCKTPCPFKESPKPKVGSCLCEACNHFKYKDVEQKIVFCTGHKHI